MRLSDRQELFFLPSNRNGLSVRLKKRARHLQLQKTGSLPGRFSRPKKSLGGWVLQAPILRNANPSKMMRRVFKKHGVYFHNMRGKLRASEEQCRLRPDASAA
ncbi:MAG: hypothetical protein ACXIT4_09455 [Erythrobacter sp.]